MKTTKLICLCSIVTCAAAVLTASADELDAPLAPEYRPLTLSAEAGTTGLGGSATWRFADHFGVRGGMHYFSYDFDSTIEGIPYNANFRPMSEVLTFNYYPSKKRSFYISAGVFFNQNQLTGTASDSTTGLTINGVPFPPGTVGTLHMKIEQQPVNPYLSIGGTFFYFDKKKHWSLGGELGVVYAGNPKVSLSRTGGIPSGAIDSAIQAEEQELENYAERYQFWPVAKLALTFSF